MATPRLFKLKSQVAAAPLGANAQNFPFARVWVDSGVFHLDSFFDYAIPESLSETAQLGVRVQVPFASREVEGIIVERISTPQVSTRIKQISKVLSPHPVATSASLALVLAVSKHWAGHPYDVLRSAIPPRVAAVDKAFSQEDNPLDIKKKPTADTSFFGFRPFRDSINELVALAEESAKTGSVLIIAPDERDVNAICAKLVNTKHRTLRLDSAVPRAIRYANFLETVKGLNKIIVGSRNSIFTPLPDGSTVIVYKEASAQHYELRSPGWNVRDVALLRADLENVRLIFCGYVPSVDLASKIDSGTIQYHHANERVNVKVFSPVDSSLLPPRIFREIRAALKVGPVLFILPRKGYANAILCTNCKNKALCACGGALSLSSRNADPNCRTCGSVSMNWKCAFCQRDKKFVLSRGIELASEEISRAFPNLPVFLSYGDVIKDSVQDKPSLVLSTPGAAPIAENGYAAVAILDAFSYFAHDDLRANERAAEMFFETSALIRPKGAVLLALDDTHPIISCLERWNPVVIVKRELTSRSEINFPPFQASAVLTVPTAQATSVAAGIQKAISDGRIPDSTRVLGPTRINQENSKISLLVDNNSRSAFVDFLHELLRKRSIANKSGLSARIDPYSL